MLQIHPTHQHPRSLTPLFPKTLSFHLSCSLLWLHHSPCHFLLLSHLQNQCFNYSTFWPQTPFLLDCCSALHYDHSSSSWGSQTIDSGPCQLCSPFPPFYLTPYPIWMEWLISSIPPLPMPCLKSLASNLFVTSTLHEPNNLFSMCLNLSSWIILEKLHLNQVDPILNVQLSTLNSPPTLPSNSYTSFWLIYPPTYPL